MPQFYIRTRRPIHLPTQHAECMKCASVWLLGRPDPVATAAPVDRGQRAIIRNPRRGVRADDYARRLAAEATRHPSTPRRYQRNEVARRFGVAGVAIVARSTAEGLPDAASGSASKMIRARSSAFRHPA